MGSKESEGEQQEIVYLVPHTHYDAVWVFTKEDYFYINIDLILKKLINLLESTEDYKFVIEQTFLLEEVEGRFPDLFSKLKKYIHQGRIEIADGERLMADTMLPQEETLIRNILAGKQYVKQRFGVDVPVMWQADSFGLNAQLPQIYRKSGYRYLAFRRGCPKRKPSEFLWEGLDGTRILSHWMPLGYRAGLDLSKLDESFRELRDLALTRHILMPCGSGVTMPQPDTSQAIEKWNRHHRENMKIATPFEFFKALEKDAVDVPIRKGEMYSGRYSEVFSDCSSSRIWVKKAQRKYENWLLCFERFVSVLGTINSYWTIREELHDFWTKLSFLSFHDVVPGTSMDSVYDEVREYIGFLKQKLPHLHDRVLNEVVEKDSAQEVRGDVVVFNPLSWKVTNWVELDLNFNEGELYRIGGLKSEDEEVEVEILRFTRFEDESLRYARIGFFAAVPPVGYKVYGIMEKKPEKESGTHIKIRGNTIETEHHQVEFDPSTGLINIYKGGEKACRANELVLEEEIGDLYYHKATMGFPMKTEGGEGMKYGSFRMKNFWIDKSPLRRVINVETDYFSLRWPYRLTDRLEPLVWRHSFFKATKKIIVYRDLPRIDFKTIVENNHSRIRLRTRFRTNMNLPEYQCETQFGTVTRPTNQYYFNPDDWVENPSGVFPSLRWVDYSDGDKGLTIINKGTPENEVRDGDIYLTLLRATDILSSDGRSGPAIPVPNAKEMKTYIYTYSVYPHEGDWKKGKSYKQGYEFNYDLIAMQISRTDKVRSERSFVSIEPDNLVMTALKPSEDLEGLVLRFYEASGEDTEGTVTLFTAPKRIVTTNLVEEEQEELEVNNNSIQLKIKPFEIVTLKIVL
ncbi:MAG: glycoside hydrolase family 38 C-terminal domain-containing protein [Archaeoglobaceae archaeon]